MSSARKRDNRQKAIEASAARTRELRGLASQVSIWKHTAEVLDAQLKAAERDGRSRQMLVARLENMQENGNTWLTVHAVLALLNDCDRLAATPWMPLLDAPPPPQKEY